MSRIYFSPKTSGIYHEAFKKDYLSTNSWPDDLVEISREDYNNFIIAPIPSGKSLTFNGYRLALVDFVPPIDNLTNIEIKWIEVELDRSREELEKVQDSDTKSVGSVSDWRNYRRSLRSWPESSDFPNKEFRPKAPDAE